MWFLLQWGETAIVWMQCASLLFIVWWLMHGGPRLLARAVWRVALRHAFPGVQNGDNARLSRK